MVVPNLTSMVGKTVKGVERVGQLIQEYEDVFPTNLPSGVSAD